jgi:hypothetical protein
LDDAGWRSAPATTCQPLMDYLGVPRPRAPTAGGA